MLIVDHGQPADAARFFAAGVHLLELLDDLSETADVEWKVADLRLGSALSALAAEGEHRSEGIDAARAAVAGLGPHPRRQWNAGRLDPERRGARQGMVRKAGDRSSVDAAGNVVWLDQPCATGWKPSPRGCANSTAQCAAR